MDKKIIIFALLFSILSSFLVSAGFFDWLTGRIIIDQDNCTDSDGGMDYYNKGVCTDSSGKPALEDSCSPSSRDNKIKLEEMYCKDNYCFGNMIDCPNGCSDGQCIQDIDLEIKEIYESGDTIKMTICSHGVYSLKDFSTMYPSLNLVGLPWKYSVFDNAGNKYDHLTSASSGLYYLKNGNCLTGAFYVESKHKPYFDETKKISIALDYQNVIKETNEANNEKTVSFPLKEVECTDSDGGKNYYEKGTTTGYEVAGIVDSFTDYCGQYGSEEGKLKEFYCGEDGIVKFILYTCPNGCADGDCIKEIKSSCTDSDGGLNYFERGTVEYYPPMAGEDTIAEDTCLTSITLKEFFCTSNNQPDALNFDCINGCSGGACIVQETEKGCIEKGYNCRDHRCQSGEEIIEELECRGDGAIPQVCCKEKIDFSIEPRIELSKYELYEGEFIDVYVYLPYFASCEIYFVDSEGERKNTGSSGCGPEGKSYSFSYYSLEARYGTVQSGEWKTGVVAKKEGYDDISLVKSFTVGVDLPYLSKNCNIRNNLGTCSINNKDYVIEFPGEQRYNDYHFTVSYNGEVESFSGITKQTKLVLKDGTKLLFEGGPATVNVRSFVFYVDIKTECGNNLCEIGERGICLEDCENDISEFEDFRVGEDECTVGCPYGTTCIGIGVRVGEKYCDASGSFQNQKESTMTCSNNFECITNMCIFGKCAEQDQCTSDSDCYDNNACTQDLCSGTPKRCSNTQINMGCNLNNKCIPISTRTKGQYCDIDGLMKNQKSEENNCNNNYECSTNVCVSNQCISQNFIQKIISWFKKLFS